jgi:hypothetical protein
MCLTSAPPCSASIRLTPLWRRPLTPCEQTGAEAITSTGIPTEDLPVTDQPSSDRRCVPLCVGRRAESPARQS